MEKITFTAPDGANLVADSIGRGPPVLLLHGGGQTRGAWRRTAAALADRGYHAIAPDARGHGDSAWATQGYTLDVFSADLRAIVQAVGESPALVGASLGGLTALLAIGESAQPIASALVLVDIATRIESEGAESIRRFMTANPDGFDTLEAAADAVARYLPHRPRPKDISGLRRNLREGADGRLYWHWDPSMFSNTDMGAREVMTARVERAAAKIAVPTLLVRGTLSEIVSSAAVDRLREILPSVEVAEVSGAGHMVAGDSNTVFASTTLDFLARVYPSTL
jgi:pimeloyl-ACP methyl ester carboxylesterase